MRLNKSCYLFLGGLKGAAQTHGSILRRFFSGRTVRNIFKPYPMRHYFIGYLGFKSWRKETWCGVDSAQKWRGYRDSDFSSSSFTNTYLFFCGLNTVLGLRAILLSLFFFNINYDDIRESTFTNPFSKGTLTHPNFGRLMFFVSGLL